MSKDFDLKIVVVPSAEAKYLIQIVDKGGSFDIMVKAPQSEVGAEMLVQAVAALTVAAAKMLADTDHFCKHAGCIFNMIGINAINELKQNFPEEYVRAKSAAAGLKDQLHDILGKDGDETIH